MIFKYILNIWKYDFFILALQESSMETWEQIEVIVAEAMDIDISEIRGSSKCADASTARHFVWYICRTENIATMRDLMREYKRLRRAIFHGISKIKFGVRTQSYYKNIYAKICDIREQKKGA